MAKKQVEEFNPVKETANGKKLQAIRWSSKALAKAREAKNKGLPLKANPFLDNDPLLLKPDLVRDYTPEEREEWLRCASDVVHFASYCYLMTPMGLKPCELRDYQVDYLRHLEQYDFSIFLSCRLSGKCLSLETLSITVLIPEGYKNTSGILKKYCVDKVKDKDTGRYNYLVTLPLFELYNIYNTSFIGKIRYHLYKLIYKLQLWQERKVKK